MRRSSLRGMFLALLIASSVGTVLATKVASPASKLSRDGNVSLELAHNYLQENKLDDAMTYAVRAVKSDPKSVEVHTMMAFVQARRGDQVKAADSFRSALAIAPNNGDLLNIYAAWLCERGSAAEADVNFRKSLEDPLLKSPRDALFNAGLCAFQTSAFEKSEQYLRRAIEISTEDGPALVLLAQVKHAQGQDFDARAFIQRWQALGILDAKGLKLAAEIEAGAGDPKSAEEYRKLLREKFPDDQSPTGEGAGRP